MPNPLNEELDPYYPRRTVFYRGNTQGTSLYVGRWANDTKTNKTIPKSTLYMSKPTQINKPKFRFTTDSGSALLYYGDEFVAKFNSTHCAALSEVFRENEIMREEINHFTNRGENSFQDAMAALLGTKIK